MTENWIEFAIGALLIVAPWIFGFADLPLAKWTDMLCGLGLVLINLWTILGRGLVATVDAPREGNGSEEASSHEVAPPRKRPRRTVAASRRVTKPAKSEHSARTAHSARSVKSTRSTRRTKPKQIPESKPHSQWQPPQSQFTETNQQPVNVDDGTTQEQSSIN